LTDAAGLPDLGDAILGHGENVPDGDISRAGRGGYTAPCQPVPDLGTFWP
jgi:hypothetical protein